MLVLGSLTWPNQFPPQYSGRTRSAWLVPVHNWDRSENLPFIGGEEWENTSATPHGSNRNTTFMPCKQPHVPLKKKLLLSFGGLLRLRIGTPSNSKWWWIHWTNIAGFDYIHSTTDFKQIKGTHSWVFSTASIFDIAWVDEIYLDVQGS